MKKMAYIIALCGIILVALATMQKIHIRLARLSPSPDATPTEGSFDPDDYADSRHVQEKTSIIHNTHSESSSAAVTPPSVHHTAVGQQKDPYAEARVIASKESALAEKGQFKRIKLVETDFKYPLIRVEETVASDLTTGYERVLERKAMVADHIMVKLQSGVMEEQLKTLNEKYGGKIRRKMHSPGLYLVEFPNPELDTVSERVAMYSREVDLIMYAEPDYIGHAHETLPNDSLFNDLWGLHNTGQSGGTLDADIDAPEAWDINTGSVNVVVGVIDTGVDYNHEDLAANMWMNPGEIPTNGVDDDGNGYIDDVYGWDFYNDDSDPIDDNGHGTHVSGTIAAVGNNGTGVVGVVWLAQIMALKFLNAGGSGPISDAIDAVNYATMMRTNGVNIRLTSNSWGGGGFSQGLKDAIEASGNEGMLFIAAAGNEGTDNDVTTSYPSGYNLTNIIAVAATDHNDGLASFSNYGATSVDLGAPGVSIKSTVPGNSYAYKSGTSMATPHVSGVAALVWGISPGATYQGVRNAILNGIDHASALEGKTVTEGRLNAYTTLLQLKPRINHAPLANTTNTVSPYIVDATIIPAALLDTNKLWVFSNTTGSTNSFTTNVMTIVTNDLYRGEIPAEPLGTRLYYYLYAETTNGLSSTDPTNAPGSLHSFKVVGPVELVVTGTPVEVGTVTPDYGSHSYPSGVLVTASAVQYTEPTNGTRYAVTGWLGSGSVPTAGNTNTFSFTITNNSSITWQWAFQYSLTQTSSVAGILSTTTWWMVSATAQTVTAEVSQTLGGTNYYFAEWKLDGVRQPDTTNTAVNPVQNIIMSASHTAVAVYLSKDTDEDGDGLGDWWEYYYFGSTNEAPGSDFDGDTYSNLWEYLDRTDPKNSGQTPQPPFISHTSLTNPQMTPAPWTITATVTDNYSVANVTLWWNRNSNSWQSTNMTLTGIGNQYTNRIPAPGTNTDSFIYRIIAQDSAGWTTTNGPYNFDVVYPVIVVNPTNFENIVLLAGTTTNRTLTIANTGNTNLEWLIDVRGRGLSEDVESGTNGWSHSGANDLWHISTNRALSSTHSWYCGSTSSWTYGSSMHARLDTPSVYLGTNAQMTFWHWIDSELYTGNYAWDGAIVEISTNNGASFEQITPVGGYPYKIEWWTQAPWPQNTPCFAGTGGWQQAAFDLSSNKNVEAVIRFHFGSDDNTEEEGWYIDDVIISTDIGTNRWLTAAPSNGIISPSSTTNLVILFDPTGIQSGEDRAGFLRVTSNDSTSPTNNIPASMSVRSIPLLGLPFVAQTSTNGAGYVTISNTVYDADGENCELELLYSTNSGSIWTNAWILNAQSSLGSPSVSNGVTNQISGIVTTNGGQAVTNQLTITWDTTNSPLQIVLSTNTLVRARVWDGLFWSAAVTSQPFMVDNEAPTVPSNLVSSSHITNTWSTNNVISVTWNNASDGNGAGMAGYGYAFTNSSTSEAPRAVLTTNLQISSSALADGTNWWVGVRAMDVKGNAGTTTNSGPCWIDANPPGTGTVTVAHSAYGNYTLSTTLTNSWGGFVDTASGIQGYYFNLTNNAGTTNGNWTTATNGTLAGALIDQTNAVYVWAQDNVGLIGSAASASILVLNSTGDFDQDGLLNSEEEISGTDAGNASSVFAFQSITNQFTTNMIIVIQWNSITGRLYSLYNTLSLTNSGGWTSIPAFTNIPGTGGTMCYTDVVNEVKSRFYKLTVSTL